MSSAAPEPNPEPVPEQPQRAEPVRGPGSLPWWAPGLLFGLVAGAVAGIAVAGEALGRATHRATARIVVRPVPGEPVVSAGECQQVAFMLRGRTLLRSVLEEREIAELGTVSGHPDPVGDYERRLAVEVGEGGMVTVTLAGRAPDDLKTVLDHLVGRFADQFAALDRRERDERLTQLEKFANQLRLEIDLQERAIELLARANGTIGSGDPGALFRDRVNQLEAELTKDEAAVALLERQAEALRRCRSEGAEPDPVEAARLVDAEPRVAPLVAQRADAVIAMEKERAAATGPTLMRDLQARLDRAEKALAAARGPVRKEVEALLREAGARRAGRELADVEVRLAVAKSAHESDRLARDVARKSLAASHASELNIEAMRRALVPQQEIANKVAAQQLQLRAAGSGGDSRAQVVEPAFVGSVDGPWRWGTVAGTALQFFAAGFVLVTAFRLTGLVFRALSAGAPSHAR